MRSTLRGLTVASLSVLMLLGSLSLATGCNTVEGAGDDIKKVGDKIEDATD